MMVPAFEIITMNEDEDATLIKEVRSSRGFDIADIVALRESFLVTLIIVILTIKYTFTIATITIPAAVQQAAAGSSN